MFSVLAPITSLFSIGLVSGVAGGLLLGATAVVMLQSLELLTDNRPLVDPWEQYLTNRSLERWYWKVKKPYNQSIAIPSDQARSIRLALFTVMFCVLLATFSLTVGVFVGLSTYSVVIRREGEAAVGKALGVAGLVCLMNVTATGYILGLTLKDFIVPLEIGGGFFYLMMLPYFLYPCISVSLNSYIIILLCGISFTPLFAFLTYAFSCWLKMRIILGAVLSPVIAAGKILEKSHSLKMSISPVPLILIISDVYSSVGQRIVFFQTATSTNTSSATRETIFVGLLAPLLWTVTIGMSLHVFLKKGRAGKICAAAAGSGAAVLGVIELVLHAVGPGPTVGALVGVAGAVGVSLSAALAATDHYGQAVGHYGFVGRLGVIVGAAVGAFLSSCAHSGLSAIFMALCGAAVPAAAFSELFFYNQGLNGGHV